MLLVVREYGGLGSSKSGVMTSLHEPDGFADQIHVVAEVADLVVGDVLHLFVESGLVADIADQGAQREHGVRREILVAYVLRNVVMSIADGRVGTHIVA